jgi:hypothetical protein
MAFPSPNVFDSFELNGFFVSPETDSAWDLSVPEKQEPVTIYNVVALTAPADASVDLGMFTIVNSFMDREKAVKLCDCIRAFASDNVSVEVYPSILET